MTPRTSQRPAREPLFWCLLAAALFGASTPATKPLTRELGPFVLAGLLYLGAAGAVSPWALRGVGALRGVDAKNQVRLAGAVVFGGILGPVLLLTGLRVAAAGSVSLWLNLETVATAVLARLFFKEHLAPRTWAAVGVVVLASLLLAPGTPKGGAAIGWVLLACLAWGLDNNLTSLIDRFTPAQVTFAKGIVAGSVNLCLGAWFEPTTPWTLGTALTALAVGALGYGASLLLYIAGAQHLGATRSQLLFSTAPAWGLLLAWVALGEPVLLTQLVAGLLMALAMWLWHHEHHEHRHTHSPVTHRHWHRHDDGHHEHSHSHPVAAGTWHSHEHPHAGVEHAHPHRPDLHHRHAHRSKPRRS